MLLSLIGQILGFILLLPFIVDLGYFITQWLQLGVLLSILPSQGAMLCSFSPFRGSCQSCLHNLRDLPAEMSSAGGCLEDGSGAEWPSLSPKQGQSVRAHCTRFPTSELAPCGADFGVQR